jgi:hypothetical protein
MTESAIEPTNDKSELPSKHPNESTCLPIACHSRAAMLQTPTTRLPHGSDSDRFQLHRRRVCVGLTFGITKQCLANTCLALSIPPTNSFDGVGAH